MIFIGIDNGLSGGIVAINEKQEIIGRCVMPVIKGKKTDYDIGKIYNFLSRINDVFINQDIFVALEKAHVRPVSGKRACFMTGFGYGVMQGILKALGVSYEIVSPKDWQKEILKGMNTGDTKKDSIMFCKRKWPKEDWTATERSKKEHDGLTDAGCMALYCYRQNR
jgi:hypothetical protein